MNAEWRECSGEAHRGTDADNCYVCIPFWARYPICPYCKNRLGRRRTGKHYRCIDEACPKYDTIFDTSSRGRDK